MVTAPQQVVFIDEVAAFLAAEPSRDEMLAYRPSEAVQRRFELLLDKQRSATLTDDEQAELHQFQQTEILLRLMKARLRVVTSSD